MQQMNRIAMVAACIFGLSACETAPPIDWQQQQVERGKTIIADCAASLCGKLDLDGAIVEDFSVLSDMTHVKILMISYTNFADLNTISSMSQLEELHIGDTDVDNLAGLSAFPNLKVLHTQNLYDVTDYSPITRLRGLQELAIGHFSFKQIAPIAALPQLRTLFMEADQDADLSPLSGHQNLQVVDFGDSRIDDISVLLTLPSLREVGTTDLFDDTPSGAVGAALIERGVDVQERAMIIVC